MWLLRQDESSVKAAESDFQSDEDRRRLIESALAIRELVKFADAMREYPEVTKVLMDRLLELVHRMLKLLDSAITNEARARDIAHYKSINSSSIIEAQKSQLPLMMEQSELAEICEAEEAAVSSFVSFLSHIVSLLMSFVI